ncbi:hypothetical protein LTR05_003752 [Lithohypha guttulata]|uniref:SET domain-containing protein n=1 Tax=Lithohypha guttulata TaxID=1690604 RepID=A0AAN7T2G0_9EURO|nr:hypothetical protein LTR05_003752 [Lithohypha guttulata]
MRYATIALDQLTPWSQLNDVKLYGTKISANIVTEEGVSKGGGLVSTSTHESEDVLLSIPSDLILSKESLLQCAKTDVHLRQLVEVLEDFIEMTISSPDFTDYAIGVRSPFTDYFCALPKEISLPTFLSADERDLLVGTSLFDALEQKLASLDREFELLKDRTISIDWCSRLWWHEESGRLSFDDWKLADALYRSRALDLPQGVGDAMVPVLDMANHSADDRYNARFEIGDGGRVLLMVRGGRQIAEHEEINITYGCGGASEMIFSYGFLEENVQSAREMFLSLPAPQDDPLRAAKMYFAKEAPGVRIFLNAKGHVSWESNFVWWLCINEEDGLDFEVLQTRDGARELRATWKGESLSPECLESTLISDDRKDIFLLRATVIIQQRIESQGEELSTSQAAFDQTLARIRSDDRKFVHETIRSLRGLELNLLAASFSALESAKQELLLSRTVAEYLAASSTTIHEPEGQQEEDFS